MNAAIFEIKSPLQLAFDNDMREFFDKTKLSLYTPQSPLDTLCPKSGSYVKELSTASKAFNDVMDKDIRNFVAKLSSVSPQEYMRQLGTAIIKVEEGLNTFADVLLTIKELKDALGELFAGCVMITKDKGIINPLHPLAAIELLRNIEASSNSSFNRVSKLIVYTYKDINAIKALYSTMSAEQLEAGTKEDFLNVLSGTLDNIIIAAGSVITTDRYIKVISNDIDKVNRRVIQKYKVSKLKSENIHSVHYLIAHQLLTKGTYVPTYGISVATVTGRGCSGTHLSGQKSANLSSHNKADGASVCCGSKDNKTIVGLRTLHHSNLSSAYNSSCFTNLSFDYGLLCIDKSISIYKAVYPTIFVDKVEEPEEVVEEIAETSEDDIVALYEAAEAKYIKTTAEQRFMQNKLKQAVVAAIEEPQTINTIVEDLYDGTTPEEEVVLRRMQEEAGIITSRTQLNRNTIASTFGDVGIGATATAAFNRTAMQESIMQQQYYTATTASSIAPSVYGQPMEVTRTLGTSTLEDTLRAVEAIETAAVEAGITPTELAVEYGAEETVGLIAAVNNTLAAYDEISDEEAEYMDQVVQEIDAGLALQIEEMSDERA